MTNSKKNGLWLFGHVMVVLALVGGGFSDAMAGSDKDSKERQAARRAQAQINQIQQQKIALEQEKVGLTTQMEELKKKSESLESGAAKSNAQRASLSRELAGLNKDKTELAEKLQEAVREMTRKQAESAQALQLKERELKRVEAELARRTNQVTTCEDKNARLYQLNVELMDKYQSKGVFGALLQAEPFTQLKSVEVENLLQEYRDKLEAEKFAITDKSSLSPRTDRTLQ